jgi:dolichyl-phosphate-mannose-protein mannosyltransferase
VSITAFIRKYYLFILASILAFAFFVRIYRISLPEHYVFDEVYHAVTAKLISRNDPRAYEWWNPPVEPNTAVDWLHPPIAKYTQAVGMLIFGETPLGWRISSVLFGVLVIAATAKLALVLFEDRRLSLLAAFLASVDGLLLVQSRVAMNDIHVTLFILLAAICYVQYFKKSRLLDALHFKQSGFYLFLTGVFTGLAMGTKWSGVFVLGILGFFEAMRFLKLLRLRMRNAKPNTVGLSKKYPSYHQKHFTSWPNYIMTRVIYLLVIPVILYVLSYSHMFLQGKTLICDGDQVEQGRCYCRQESSWWVDGLKQISPDNSAYFESLEARGGCKRLISHFSELHHQILWYQTHLTATHQYQSRPLDWFLDLKPVWMSVDYAENSIANIYSQGNPILFWLGDIAVIASILFIIEQSGQQLITALSMRRRLSEALSDVFASPLSFSFIFLIVTYFAVWLPWQLSPRIMFFYHYTPAVPFLCIILAYWLLELNQFTIETKNYRIYIGRVLIALFLFIILGTFILFYPNWIGIPVTPAFADKVYFAIKSWK